VSLFDLFVPEACYPLPEAPWIPQLTARGVTVSEPVLLAFGIGHFDEHSLETKRGHRAPFAQYCFSRHTDPLVSRSCELIRSPRDHSPRLHRYSHHDRRRDSHDGQRPDRTGASAVRVPITRGQRLEDRSRTFATPRPLVGSSARSRATGSPDRRYLSCPRISPALNCSLCTLT
jgi:hypothetical protein